MGILYLVATPIGNLEDITLRALRILKKVPCIACEDTRRTRQLLRLLELPLPELISLHDHNEAERTPLILRRLEGGDVALLSDAGTPAISDPGYRLVRGAVEAGVEIVPLPGPSALVTALCASGLPSDQFRFLGFPPAKTKARQQLLMGLAGASETLIFYVAPHSLEAFLEAALEAFGDRPAVIARELSKRYESFHRGSLERLCSDPGTIRGEMVVMFGGAPPEAAPDEATLEGVVRQLLEAGYAPSKAAKEAARRTGGRRDEAYRLAVGLRKSLG